MLVKQFTMRSMKKDEAIRLLGGTPAKAAEAVGVMVQAVYQWKDPLTPIVSDRVQAALARMEKGQRHKDSGSKRIYKV